MEPPFDKLPGVTATISGYTGGRTANPTYEDVTSGTTGHARWCKSCTTRRRSPTRSCSRCSG
jgi:peptide methionine sulfoxide reductase MsrA